KLRQQQIYSPLAASQPLSFYPVGGFHHPVTQSLEEASHSAATRRVFRHDDHGLVSAQRTGSRFHSAQLSGRRPPPDILALFRPAQTARSRSCVPLTNLTFSFFLSNWTRSVGCGQLPSNEPDPHSAFWHPLPSDRREAGGE